MICLNSLLRFSWHCNYCIYFTLFTTGNCCRVYSALHQALLLHSFTELNAFSALNAEFIEVKSEFTTVFVQSLIKCHIYCTHCIHFCTALHFPQCQVYKTQCIHCIHCIHCTKLEICEEQRQCHLKTTWMSLQTNSNVQLYNGVGLK